MDSTASPTLASFQPLHPGDVLHFVGKMTRAPVAMIDLAIAAGLQVDNDRITPDVTMVVGTLLGKRSRARHPTLQATRDMQCRIVTEATFHAECARLRSPIDKPPVAALLRLLTDWSPAPSLHACAL